MTTKITARRNNNDDQRLLLLRKTDDAIFISLNELHFCLSALGPSQTETQGDSVGFDLENWLSRPKKI